MPEISSLEIISWHFSVTSFIHAGLVRRISMQTLASVRHQPSEIPIINVHQKKNANSHNGRPKETNRGYCWHNVAAVLTGKPHASDAHIGDEYITNIKVH